MFWLCHCWILYEQSPFCEAVEEKRVKAANIGCKNTRLCRTMEVESKLLFILEWQCHYKCNDRNHVDEGTRKCSRCVLNADKEEVLCQ